MSVRGEVLEFAALGPLPSSDATAAEIERFEKALERIEPPLSVAEATALLSSFGLDDCFGLAWTLVHLIETAPGAPITERPPSHANEWLHVLWERCESTLSAAAVRSVCDLVVALSRGDYGAIRADRRSSRLTPLEVREGIDEYGGTLVPLPSDGLDWDLYPLDGQPGVFAVDVPLWTAEEGRSDLTLSLTVHDRDGSVEIAVDDLRVL